MVTVYEILDVSLLLALPYFLFRIYKSLRHRADKHQAVVCLRCGREAPAKLALQGSALLEAGLWLLLIFPGLLYSVWRYSTRKKQCGACAHQRLVMPETPAARARLSDARTAMGGRGKV